MPSMAALDLLEVPHPVALRPISFVEKPAHDHVRVPAFVSADGKDEPAASGRDGAFDISLVVEGEINRVGDVDDFGVWHRGSPKTSHGAASKVNFALSARHHRLGNSTGCASCGEPDCSHPDPVFAGVVRL